ncbi:MAG: CoA-transferase [Thermodesulfobacteriota bacterium]
MLDKTRLRNRKLFDLIMSADEAATMITNGMTVACGGFTSTGCPKAVPLALARAAENGSNHKITLLSGGSVGPEVE